MFFEKNVNIKFQIGKICIKTLSPVLAFEVGSAPTAVFLLPRL